MKVVEVGGRLATHPTYLRQLLIKFTQSAPHQGSNPRDSKELHLDCEQLWCHCATNRSLHTPILPLAMRGPRLSLLMVVAVEGLLLHLSIGGKFSVGFESVCALWPDYI